LIPSNIDTSAKLNSREVLRLEGLSVYLARHVSFASAHAHSGRKERQMREREREKEREREREREREKEIFIGPVRRITSISWDS
jgi:hypothetical protein